MDSSLLIAAVASFIAGLLGYIIARLWIKPIVGYNITKRKLDQELTRYLELMNAATGPDDNTSLRRARQHAVDLVSCFNTDIPYWYRLLLESRKESPTEAPGMLTNLSKIQNSEHVINRIKRVRKIMGLK